MVLKDNFFYWEYSCNNPEPILDPFYFSIETIITDEEFIKSVNTLRAYLSIYCTILQEDLPSREKEIILDIYLTKIEDLLDSIPNIQHTEFIAFWKTLDMSYSIFSKYLPRLFGEKSKKDFLREVIKYYCKERKKLYDKEGYSNIVVQALYDDRTSKRQSSAGVKKLEYIVKESFPEIKEVFKIVDLKSLQFAYYIVDKNQDARDSKQLCDIMRKELNILYKFGATHNNKVPDIILKINSDIFIIEAKHIKEGGGGQDKQILELIDFIRYEEDNKNIHYVSFLDGLYFNLFVKLKREEKLNEIIKSNATKLLEQYNAIKSALNTCKNNFFVNTFGIKLLINDAKNNLATIREEKK